MVVGILIALQVNNWNNQRLADRQMQAFMRGILEDLRSDTLQYERRIRILNELSVQKRKLLQLSNFDGTDTDSLFILTRPRTANYTINTTTFDKVRSSGITQISDNDSLSRIIYRYYTLGVISLHDYMHWDLTESTEDANYFHFEHDQFEMNLDGYDLEGSDAILNFQEESVRRENLIKIISGPAGRNHLKRNYARKMTIANRLKVFKENATTIIMEMERELSR